jgi:hypothetical protein
LSFFDEDEPPSTEIREPRASRATPAPRSQRTRRRAQSDHHAVVVRRRVLAVVALIVLIVVVVLIASLVSGGKREALETYGRSVSSIVKESNEGVSQPFFQTISAASSQQHGSVEERIDELRADAESQAARAQRLSVPSGLEAAQRDLLLALDMRSEALMKIKSHIAPALAGGGESATAYKQIAGAMELLLSSDVIYSQRVAPLVEGALRSNGAGGQALVASRFVPNLGWLEPSTVTARMSGHSAPGTGAAPAPGTHGSALVGVSVGSTTLASGELNHISSGSNPTFTVKVENTGETPETDVKVDVAVSAAGKLYSSYNIIPKTTAGHTTSVEVPIEGLPLNTGAKIEVYVEPVPGETALENNKATYEATFS